MLLHLTRWMGILIYLLYAVSPSVTVLKAQCEHAGPRHSISTVRLVFLTYCLIWISSACVVTTKISSCEIDIKMEMSPWLPWFGMGWFR